MRWSRALSRIGLCVVVVLIAITATAQPAVYAARPGAPRNLPQGPKFPLKRPRPAQNARVVLSGVPDDIIPGFSNSWQCPCDSDGCWPGCFTVASASLLKYWSQKGFPNLWDGNENGTLARLRELFGHLLCYGNGDANGSPGDSGYDAFDVAGGLRQFAADKNYAFTVTAIPEPAFDQIVDEIDAGRPLIGAFGESPWGSHAGTIIGYDTSGGRQVMIVRPNLWQKGDTELVWGEGYRGFAIVTIGPGGVQEAAAEPAAAFQLVIDDKDAGFSSGGAWQEEPGVGYGGATRSTLSTDPTNLGPSDDTAWAEWTPQLPYDGLWEVMAWMPIADQDDTTAHIVTYRVTHAEGMSLVRRSQRDAVQGWMSLGIFPMVKGERASVALGNLTGDNPPRKVWADTARFVWRAPILVRSEEDDSENYLVQDGLRRRITDPDTLTALRLGDAESRKLAPLAMEQYPLGEPLPSMYASWVGQYFDNTFLAPPAAMLRQDTAVNFSWGNVTPSSITGEAGFSARWSRIMAFSEGLYPFAVEAVGGVRLWVDGQLVIDDWDAGNILIRRQQEISVTSGLHRIDFEYVNREGYARAVFDNLPPNVPLLDDAPAAEWAADPTAFLRWRDGSDPDSPDKPRRYFAAVWSDDTGWSANSGWIDSEEWVAALPADGRYQWRVSAADGETTSDWTAPRQILIDRTPPWAQMVRAEGRNELVVVRADVPSAEALSAEAPAAETPVAEAPIAETPAAETETSTTEAPPSAAPAVATETAPGAQPAPELQAPFPARSNMAGLRLTWWATDMHSGVASFDLQARELIRASTIYSPIMALTETTRLAYELILSGSEEITRPMIITELVPYTASIPLLLFTPLTDTQWFTFATGIVNTETIFLGTPGSTYEFRVRATDRAGNTQAWYDGYSVQAQVDPQPAIRETYIPLVMR